MEDNMTLERLASQFIEEHRRWLNPSIQFYQSQYSHLSQQIEELFPVLLAMEQWKGVKEIDHYQNNVSFPLKEKKLGDITLVREIGRGKLSIVYSARQEHLGRDVAVKLLPCHFRNGSRIRERFEREARTVARLQHRNIVSIFNFGETEEYCYYVMQMIQGAGLDWVVSRLSDFEQKIHPDEFLYAINNNIKNDEISQTSKSPSSSRELGKESWKSFAGIILQAVKALQYSHEQGTLHNNIKPSNILLDRAGHVWLTDFALAQYHQEEPSQIHPDSSGMFRYLAPERFKSISSEKSDLYSIGAVLYELCTLTPMIEAGSSSQVIDQVVNQTIVRPRDLNPNIPAELEKIILKAITKQDNKRYSSAKEMRNELMSFIKN